MVGGANSGCRPSRGPRADLSGRLLGDEQWRCQAESEQREKRDAHERSKRDLKSIGIKSVAASRKPNSVPFASRALRRNELARMTTIPLAPPSLAGSSDLPGDSDGPSGPASPARCRAGKPCASLFGLAPCGVLPATRVTTGAVRSYRTFSPLPASTRRRASARQASRPRRRAAVYFLCHCPSGCPDRALPGALPCGVRTFLPPSRSFEPLRRTVIWLAATI